MRKRFPNIRIVIYFLLIFLCLTPWISPALALFIGLMFAVFIGVPFPSFNKKASKYLLQISVVGLGFKMNLYESLQAGADGILFTIFSVVAVLFGGIFIGRLFKLDEKVTYLISSGTAICGGSAIAAVSPIAKADQNQISISLAVVFILNAIALFIFPTLGKWMHLTEHQFGVWAAIAIHDTSSVVGAGAAYGTEALQIATTVKLTRALWIIPLSIYTTYRFNSKGEKLYIPWFILFFILAMLLNTYIHIPEQISHTLVQLARQGMTLTLFFIGASLSPKAIKSVGVNALVFAVVMWILIGVSSLLFILNYY